MKYSKVMITGGAGFIGSHVVERLLNEGIEVLCIDDFNDFYSPVLKQKNIENHVLNPLYTLVKGDIKDKDFVLQVVAEWCPDAIIHLAARAGVRPSLSEPNLYESTNIAGTLNVLEAGKKINVQKIIFGSSSSVYGLNTKVPFAETDALLKPASPYAATKIAGEALCHAYAHLYGLPIVSLRFFTVYGPRQRPDLAIRKFIEKIVKGEEIVLYGDGLSGRDYTYIDDIVEGIFVSLYYEGDIYEVFNLGNSTPVKLNDLIAMIEAELGIKAKFSRTGDQPGDVPITYADINLAREKLGYNPKISLEEGLRRMFLWLNGICIET